MSIPGFQSHTESSSLGQSYQLALLDTSSKQSTAFKSPGVLASDRQGAHTPNAMQGHWARHPPCASWLHPLGTPDTLQPWAAQAARSLLTGRKETEPEQSAASLSALSEISFKTGLQQAMSTS